MTASFAWVWFDWLEDIVVARRWVEVEQGSLYRSAQLSRFLVREMLERNHIALVVWLTDFDETRPDHRAERDAIETLGVERLNLHLRGNGTGDIRNYATAIEAIAKARAAGRPTLVHCAAGARRTGGVLAAYQVLVEGKPVELAFEELNRFGARPVWESPLLDYLNDHMFELATLLVERGVIDRIPNPVPYFEPPHGGDHDTVMSGG